MDENGYHGMGETNNRKNTTKDVRQRIMEKTKTTTEKKNSSNVWLLHLIVFLVSFLSHEAGFLQLVLKSIHTLFIGQGTVLKNLACTVKRVVLVFDWFRFGSVVVVVILKGGFV